MHLKIGKNAFGIKKVSQQTLAITVAKKIVREISRSEESRALLIRIWSSQV